MIGIPNWTDLKSIWSEFIYEIVFSGISLCCLRISKIQFEIIRFSFFGFAEKLQTITDYLRWDEKQKQVLMITHGFLRWVFSITVGIRSGQVNRNERIFLQDHFTILLMNCVGWVCNTFNCGSLMWIHNRALIHVLSSELKWW